MKRLVAAIMLALLAQSASANFVDGTKLNEWSDSYYRWQNGKTSDNDALQATMYLGYLQAVFDSYAYAHVCSPETTRLSQIEAIVRQYVKMNPKTWGDTAPTIIIRALKEAFPCPTQPQSTPKQRGLMR